MKLNIKPKVNHVWHIRVQLWRYGKRYRRRAYRVIAGSKAAAMDAVVDRLSAPRARVVTRCVQGKAV